LGDSTIHHLLFKIEEIDSRTFKSSAVKIIHLLQRPGFAFTTSITTSANSGKSGVYTTTREITIGQITTLNG
jgi:hypothetical protein